MKTKNTEQSINSRRSFLKGAQAGVAIAVGGASSIATAKSCKTSDGDILGPFYRPNAKANINLVTTGAEGERLKLTGTILRPDCKSPVVGATIDFWQADHKGAYDIKTPDEKIAVENYQFRAVTQTDKDGNFTIETVIPGRYGIPPGLEGFEQYAGQTRPGHFHLTVTHPIYLPLTTQVYMTGDPFIAKDPWAKHSKNMVTLKRENGKTSGQFQVVLGNRPGQRT